MSHRGKSHLVIMFTVGPDDVAEGDRIFASHGEWMKGNPREGDVALLDYTISKGPELLEPDGPELPNMPCVQPLLSCERSNYLAQHWSRYLALPAAR